MTKKGFCSSISSKHYLERSSNGLQIRKFSWKLQIFTKTQNWLHYYVAKNLEFFEENLCLTYGVARNAHTGKNLLSAIFIIQILATTEKSIFSCNDALELHINHMLICFWAMYTSLSKTKKKKMKIITLNWTWLTLLNYIFGVFICWFARRLLFLPIWRIYTFGIMVFCI